MIHTIATVAFDGDDTLWHNETIFSMTQEKFCQLVLRHVPDADIEGHLRETEIRNLKMFGYGVKGFTLAMIETAIEVSRGRITAAEIQQMIDFGKAMLDHPVELLDSVAPTVAALRERFRLMLITKGDLFDQESKIARSGLAGLFERIEIVSEKDEATYRQILARHGVAPAEFLMVGNSLRSDILPVLRIGGMAVHIPYHVTWAHEMIDPAANPPGSPPDGMWALDSIADLPALLGRLSNGSGAAEP